MSLFSRLTEKSWETPGAAMPEPGLYRPEPARVGLIVYFVVMTMLFLLLSSAYGMRMGMHGGHASMHDWHPMPEPPLIWINSAVLMLASLAWEAARAAARQGAQTAARRAFISAGALGFLFLGGQLMLWREFYRMGYFVEANPANSFFYLITALHGLHILGGLFFWALALVRSRGDGAARLPIELCAAYWHFLLLIWIGMLALLIST